MTTLYYVGRKRNCAACNALTKNNVCETAVNSIEHLFNKKITLEKIYWENEPQKACQVTNNMMTTPVVILLDDNGVHHIILNSEVVTPGEMTRRITSALGLSS